MSRESGDRASGERARAEIVCTRRLEAWVGKQVLLGGITLGIPRGLVTAIVGPTGSGKSTFVRCLNRMHEAQPLARVSGEVLLEGQDVYARGVDAASVRRRFGMVFARPNPFPTMSVRDNVLSGLGLAGERPSDGSRRLERALRAASLWDEVKDRLDAPGISLSLGQQQRLCVARCLCLEPEVIVMDEPCSSLDPEASTRMEELVHELRGKHTIVLATRSPQQAARVSDHAAFFLGGELVEQGTTDELFTKPRQQRTEDFLTGRFG